MIYHFSPDLSGANTDTGQLRPVFLHSKNRVDDSDYTHLSKG